MRDIIVREFESNRLLKSRFEDNDGNGGLFSFAADDYIGTALDAGYDPPFAARVAGFILDETDTNAQEVINFIKANIVNNDIEVIVVGNGWIENGEEHYPPEDVYEEVRSAILTFGYNDLYSYDPGNRTAFGLKIPDISTRKSMVEE